VALQQHFSKKGLLLRKFLKTNKKPGNGEEEECETSR
jgi:hypothetical protein